MLYLESLISFSLLKEEVSCQLFGRQSHSVCLFFFFVSLSSIQKWESWITLSIVMSYLGIPFVIQMGCQREAKCSFPSWRKNWFKNSNLEACFQCQTAEWLARKMDGVPVMQTAYRFLLHEDSAIKENDSHQQSLTVIFNMPHLPLARVLFCFVLWTRKNSLTGWACEIRELFSQRIKFPNTPGNKGTL